MVDRLHLYSTGAFSIDEIRIGPTFADVVPLPGDYNHDRSVDAADYVVWRKSPSAFGGDPNGYNIWRTNFGYGAPMGAASSSLAPEPSGLALLIPASPALLRRFKYPRL